MGIPSAAAYDNRLYRALDKLIVHKDALEKHLKERFGTLFGISYDIVLYDVTSTFFDVACVRNPQAQRGYSRDNRGDCKQVCIGLLVTREGIPLGYEVFEGNRHDSRTVETIVAKMAAHRSNISDWTPEELWRTYIQLTEADAAFPVHKNDLNLHPVWHQREDRLQAHILVCFLTYVLWKCFGQMCKHSGLGTEPRKVIEEIKQLTVTDVVLPTRKGIVLRLRCVSKPEKHLAILLHKLGLQIPERLNTPTIL